ncbi:hypothetical protein ISS30_11350, partial [bacterium]|nr:hypothetical protein [bacterium]
MMLSTAESRQHSIGTFYTRINVYLAYLIKIMIKDVFEAELIQPDHKLIKQYYKEKEKLAGQGVIHELGVRTAFFNLLADTAKLYGMILIHVEGARKQVEDSERQIQNANAHQLGVQREIDDLKRMLAPSKAPLSATPEGA